MTGKTAFLAAGVGLVSLGPQTVSAQEDAYLSCSEDAACYTSDLTCYTGRAGGITLQLSDRGETAVIDGIGPTLAVTALARNVYRVPVTDGFWVIVLSKDLSRYVMTQAFPDLPDGAVVTGPCERRNY